MYKIASILFLISFAFISCNNTVSTTDIISSSIKQGNTSNNENENNTQTLITKKGDSIYLEISKPVGMSLNNLTIKTPNFENTKSISIIDIDPVSKIELYDIDNNGFEELFIFTTAAGSGSYGNIYAFSTTNKQLKTITVDSFKIDDNYSGHDRFYFENNTLIREYPSSDKQIKVTYKLIDNRLLIDTEG